uniref:C2H2-type domain-containing protein n=1 Tax=Cyanoderma ruficeps TaxID=181631 RepID=A0A8C3R4R6_9PASS
MSAVPEEVKAEDGTGVPMENHFFCEVCKVYCTGAVSLQSHYRGAKHRKREKAVRRKTFYCSSAVIQVSKKNRVLKRVKRAFKGYITCLKDFMNDPRREEPLIGLEHVVEMRFEGRKEPRYECRLCGCNTEVAPMIEHLSGYKHRREYISKEFPDKMRQRPTDIKKCKVSFLRRIAEELEETEGLKMYQIEGFERPAISAPLKKEARLEDDYENDPVRKQKALEFLETFHITSDSEATLVVHITQELMEALKAFCEKKAADNYTDSSGPLVSVPQDEFPESKIVPEHYGPDGEYKGSFDWNQGFLSQYEECSEDASLAPAHSHSYQADGGSSSCHVRSDNFAMVSPLRDCAAVDPYSPISGISEGLRQLRNSVFYRNVAAGASSYETSLVKEYSAEYISTDVQGSELLDNRLSFGWENIKWRNQQACTEVRHVSDQELSYPNPSASYPSSGRYSTDYSPQNYSSYNESVNTGTSSVNSTVSGRVDSRWHQDTRWHEWNEDSRWNKKSSWKQESRCQEFRYQISGYHRDWSSHQDSFSGSGLYQDHQQFRSSEEMFGGVDVGLAPSAVNRLLGKDVPAMTSMLQQLAPYYPGLQSKIVISLYHVK